MSKLKKFTIFIIVELLTSHALAISSSDIKNDNLVKLILLTYEETINVIFKNPFVILPILVLIIGVTYALINRYSIKCPSCKKWSALIVTNSELISQKEGFKTVTRTDNISTFNSHSDGTIERKEQVRILEKTIKLTYKCKYCKGIFESTRKTETENFFR